MDNGGTRTQGAGTNGLDAGLAARSRTKLAQIVVFGCFLTIFILLAVMWGVSRADKTPPYLTDSFNAILPVLASWMGTVLAFYFSAQNSERTSDTLNTLLRQSGILGASDQRVVERMIPVDQILNLQEIGDNKPEDFPISDDLFSSKPGQPSVTRLVFLKNGVFYCIVHQSTFNAFKLKSPPGAGGYTLGIMMADQDTRGLICDLVAFIGVSASLNDARNALALVPGGNDVIVTIKGRKDSPMVGWLTNVDLGKPEASGSARP